LGRLNGRWVTHDVRDEAVVYVRRWSKRFPDATRRIITDNGPHFIARVMPIRFSALVLTIKIPFHAEPGQEYGKRPLDRQQLAGSNAFVDLTVDILCVRPTDIPSAI
jgi:hypothetical protein